MGKLKKLTALIASKADEGAIFTKARKFVAMVDGKYAGKLVASFPHKSQRVYVQDVSILPEFQKRGIGKQLFNYLAKFTQKANRRFIATSSDIIHPAQVKIRDGYKTKFIANGLGKYGDQGALVPAKLAQEIANKNSPLRKLNNFRQSSVRAVSDVKNIKFIKRHGRIIPIRIKK